MGKKFKDTFGHVGGAALGGLVGLKKPRNHGVPYSLTEEFVTVYRMHALLPDQLQLRDTSAKPGPNKSPPLIEKYEIYNIKQINFVVGYVWSRGIISECQFREGSKILS